MCTTSTQRALSLLGHTYWASLVSPCPAAQDGGSHLPPPHLLTTTSASSLHGYHFPSLPPGIMSGQTAISTKEASQPVLCIHFPLPAR